MTIKISLPNCDSGVTTYDEMKNYLKQLKLAVHHAQKSVENAEREQVEEAVSAVAEIVTNEQGDVLWVKRYPMSRIHKIGDFFVHESKTYCVIGSAFTQGMHGGGLVEHIVRPEAKKPNMGKDHIYNDKSKCMLCDKKLENSPTLAEARELLENFNEDLKKKFFIKETTAKSEKKENWGNTCFMPLPTPELLAFQKEYIEELLAARDLVSREEERARCVAICQEILDYNAHCGAGNRSAQEVRVATQIQEEILNPPKNDD